MKEIPELKTTLHGLMALENLRGEPGSFQDSLHADAIAAHAMRDTLDWAVQGRDNALARVAELEAGLGVSQVRVSVLENAMESGYQDGRRHACAILSQLVFNSDGVPMGLDDLLTLCAHVETDFAAE